MIASSAVATGVTTHPERPSILYMEDFDSPAFAAQQEAAPDIIAPALTEDDVTRARAEGREAGLKQAREELATLHHELRGASLAAIADALATSQRQAARVTLDMAEETACTILALLQAALPATMLAAARTESAALLREAIPLLRDEANLHIAVHPDLAGDLTADLAALTRKCPGLAVVADPALSPGTVAVTWEGGSLTRDTDEVWREISRALAPLNLPATASSEST